jgi:hypothetical protein
MSKSWVSACMMGFVVATCATGCATSTAVVSQQKSAYVVDGSVFGTTMYYCRVIIGGKPVCNQVKEVE